jgi:5,10-methylene-tetrahydrofolate dehydrogenase/methenyl tetrahydrofolate cyclohydrolase
MFENTLIHFSEMLASSAPVPGGVGSVSISVLVSHVVQAAGRKP